MCLFHRLLCLSVLLIAAGCSPNGKLSELQTPFERSGGEETTTYEEGIAWWKALEEASPYVCVQTFGATDAGLPLHLVVINASGNFSQEKISASEKCVLLINNGIHPGEPDGIDASMLFARDILQDEAFRDRYANVVFLIIPFYNVGGALHRNCCSRANQDGPKSYGFRGNARNLDLNRDFIKCDSKNAQSFSQLFTTWKPDVYLETHVSNGADYPYTMTYLLTHPDKLTPPLAGLLQNTLAPALAERMKAEGDEMIPYVNVFGTSPDSGYSAFYDSPRYSTGYAALHQSIGLLTETHMLKPFPQRVASTRRFLHALGSAVNEHHELIKAARRSALEALSQQQSFPVDWKVDSSRVNKLPFRGYAAYYDTSEVTGLPQLYYDRTRPWEREIDYYDHLVPVTTVTAPKQYLVPAAWTEVVDRLRWNGVALQQVSRDTTVEVVAYEIMSYQTTGEPFEGHYLHYNTQCTRRPVTMSLLANSYYIADLRQPGRRFIIEVLEPRATDAYFNWNFYDEILQQKEWFSSYVFDREAKALLADTAIYRAFCEKKEMDPEFCRNAFSQLYHLYRQSDHYERERHMIYPVFRIE